MQGNPQNQEDVKQHLVRQWFRLVKIIVGYLFWAVVYGSAIVLGKFLTDLLLWSLSEDIKTVPIIGLGVHYFKIGGAALALIAAFIHGGISTWAQLKLDWRLSQEGDLK